MNVLLFNYSLVDGDLECFQVLTIINNAAMNIVVNVLVDIVPV